MDRSYFSTRYSHDPNRRRVWKAIAEYLQAFIPPHATVLDIGAGYCDLINQVRAAKKFAFDANPEVALYCGPDVQFVPGQGGLPFDLPTHSVDVAMASNLLEHLSDERCSALFDSLNHTLKENGRFILIQPNYYYCYREYWDDFTHVKAFTHVSLVDLLRSRHFRIVRVEKRFMPFSFKSHLAKSYWMTRLYLSSSWRPLAKQMLVVAER